MIEEDEIDLRPYFSALIRWWKLILSLTIGAAAIAAVISLATPVTYEANSIVAVASLGAKPVPEIKSYIDLATSDGVLSELAKSPGASARGAAFSPAELRGRLKATAGSDPSLINLKVVASDPEGAAQLARQWSDLFVRVALSTFNPAKDSYDQLQAQLTRARAELRQAEEGLAAIESRSQLGLLQAELASLGNNLAALYASKATLQTAEENVRSLQSRLQQAPSNFRADVVDDAAIMLIQSSILGGSIQFQLSSGSQLDGRAGQMILPSSPLQLQLPEQGDRTVASQLAALQGITTLIRDRAAGADRQVAALRPLITELESKVSGILIEQGDLIARRDSLRASSKELEAKTSQAKAILESGTGQPRIVSEANANSSPQPGGTTRNVVLAAMLGLIVGVAAAFGVDHLRSRRQPQVENTQPTFQL